MSGDAPKVYSTSTPKARKEHRCCECRGTISVGETYHVFSGIWDSASTFKTCAECEQLRSDVTKTIEDLDDYPAFGSLYEHVFEGNEHAEWIARFMVTRRKRNAPESPNGWMEKREAKLSTPNPPSPRRENEMSTTTTDTLAAIGHRLRTQDNRMTDNPIFVVFQKERIYTDQGGEFEWVNSDGWEPASEDEAEELDALDDDFKDAVLNGRTFVKSFYMEMDRFVTACFTEAGAKEYLEANGHNLKRPHIYAASLYRNAEMIAIRERLMANASPSPLPESKRSPKT